VKTLRQPFTREKRIKAGSRRKKIDLVNDFNPGWRDLFFDLWPLAIMQQNLHKFIARTRIAVTYPYRYGNVETTRTRCGRTRRVGTAFDTASPAAGIGSGPD
jgi:hypothetical protein